MTESSTTIVCNDYAVPEGYVAISVVDSDPYGRNFRLVPYEDAPVQAIIACYYCQRPAVVIDHHYPWLVDHNRCAEHFDQQYQKPKRPYRRRKVNGGKEISQEVDRESSQ